MASEADLERVRELYRTLEEHRKQGSSVSSETPELREVLEQTLEPFAAVMRAIVAKVPLFKDCPESFLVDIAKSLEPEVYFPEEVMIEEGEEGREVFLIHEGSAEVLKGGKPLAQLPAGAFFGEVALIMKDTKRTATVRAKTLCYMAKLTHSKFEAVTTKYPEQQVAFLSLAQTRLTQDAVRSVLGVDSSGMSGESFTQRLEHVLKHAIGDKNREIYHLNEELKALRFELSKREKQIEMLHDIKRGSSSSLPSAPAPAARKETILTDDRRIIGESSRWRAFNLGAIKKLLPADVQQRLEAKEHDLPSMEGSAQEFIRMIKRYRSLNTIFYLREKLKTCSAQFFIEFIESNGLKALAAASDSLGNKDRVTFGDVGAQIELVLCWRTLMNRPFVLSAYSSELAHTVPSGIEFALSTGNLMVRTRMFELFAAMTLVSSKGYKLVYRGFDEVSKRHHLPNRFSILVQSLSTVKEAWFQTSCMMIINGLINTPADLETRISIRKQLYSLGFADLLELMAEDTKWLRNGAMLKTQIDTFRDSAKQDSEDLAELHASLPVDLQDPEALLKRILASDDVNTQSSVLNLLQHMLIISENKAYSAKQWSLLESVAGAALSLKPADDYSNIARLTVREFLAQIERSHQAIAPPPPPPMIGTGPPPPLPPAPSVGLITPVVTAPPPPPVGDDVPVTGGPPPPPPPPGGDAPVTGGPPPPPMMGGGPPPPPPPPGGDGDAAVTGGPPPPPMMGGGPPPPPMMGGGPPPPPMMGGGPRPPGAAAALPPKPKPQPKVKMMPLFWSKIPPAKVAKTGWLQEELKDIDQQLPTDELESLFCVVDKKAEDASLTASGAAAASKKPTVVQLLDPRRGNNVAIMLSQFKNKFSSHADIGVAINAADDESLGTSAIEVLLKYAPTSEEVDAVTSYSGDLNMLGTAEKFFLEIKNVQRLEDKLRALFFKREFDSRIASTGEELRMMIDSIVNLRKSKKFKGLLEVILAVGNYMNAQNNRGGAYGFQLDTLKKLSDTKSPVNKRMSLMHYLTQLVDSKTPELLRFKDEIGDLSRVCKLSLDQIKSELAQLRKSLGELDSLLQETEPVPFFAKMKTFHERAETEVNLVEQLLPKLDDAIKDLANFFGEDPNKINVLDLLNLVNDFTESFFKARDDLAKQKDADQKRLAREAKKQAEANAPKRPGMVKTLPGDECNVDSILAAVRRGGFTLKRTSSQASLEVSRD